MVFRTIKINEGDRQTNENEVLENENEVLEQKNEVIEEKNIGKRATLGDVLAM